MKMSMTNDIDPLKDASGFPQISIVTVSEITVDFCNSSQTLSSVVHPQKYGND